MGGPRTPIMLITGPLGSGKTTLLRRILESGMERLAVLMNEFGEVPIDSRVIRGENVRIVELAGGCVCCSLSGEFEAAVREIIDKAAPGFIVVEATGLAEADALVYEVEDNLPQTRLDSVICLVDTYVTVKHPHVGYTAKTQLSAADIVLINKIDLVTTQEVRDVEARVREFNETAVTFKTVGCDVNPSLLFGLGPVKRPFSISPHGEPEFQSFTFETDAPIDFAKFREAMSGLPHIVYRAKGFVRSPDGGHLFNYVVGRADFEKSDAGKTELVFIGRCLTEARDMIEESLRKCEVR